MLYLVHACSNYVPRIPVTVFLQCAVVKPLEASHFRLSPPENFERDDAVLCTETHYDMRVASASYRKTAKTVASEFHICSHAVSQYSEGPATGHLDKGFPWFPYIYKQMLTWFPRFQVATTCFSCSPPDSNLLVTNFIFCIHVK